MGGSLAAGDSRLACSTEFVRGTSCTATLVFLTALQLPIQTVAATSLFEHALVAGIRTWAASRSCAGGMRACSAAATAAACVFIVAESVAQWFISLVVASLFQARETLLVHADGLMRISLHSTCPPAFSSLVSPSVRSVQQQQ